MIARCILQEEKWENMKYQKLNDRKNKFIEGNKYYPSDSALLYPI